MTQLGEYWERPYTKTEVPSLSEVWAKKYLDKLEEQDRSLNNLSRTQLHIDVAKMLKELLRPISAQAWSKTESLLSHEIRRHQISAELIDPWSISKDAHQVYEKALSAYADKTSPERLSVAIASDIGHIRKHHTAADPRVIGFVSMQFHYCGQILIDQAPDTEQIPLSAYFKVIDDHLYMPLQRAYDAAARYDYDAPQLQTVRNLLPHSSKIAANVVDQVNQLYPTYTSYTGLLSSQAVRISSIRDVEMFQVYIWTCVLEQNIAAIQQELFPLCVMLYPKLNVSWELVRQMLYLLQNEFLRYGQACDQALYKPYYESLWRIFSDAVVN
ncbi:MAG: hypothetical protein ACFBSF_17185 [Leptolyngbyaceae cyanobacterium]